MATDVTNRLDSPAGSKDPTEAICGFQSGMWAHHQPLAMQLGRVDGVPHPEALKVSNWVKTETGTNIELPIDGSPNVLQLTTGVNTGDGHNLQFSKDGGTTVWEQFRPDATRKILYEVRMKVDTAIEGKGEFGIIVTDTSINGGVTDGIYFRKKGNDAKLYMVLEKNSNETEKDLSTDISTSYNWANNTYKTLGLVISTSSVEVWVDGLLAFTQTTVTNLPDDEDLALSFAMHARTTTAVTTTIQHMVCFQEAI